MPAITPLAKHLRKNHESGGVKGSPTQTLQGHQHPVRVFPVVFGGVSHEFDAA